MVGTPGTALQEGVLCNRSSFNNASSEDTYREWGRGLHFRVWNVSRGCALCSPIERFKDLMKKNKKEFASPKMAETIASALAMDHSRRLVANHKVVRELSIRFDQQQRQWNNYSKLLGFFVFILLFTVVLYLQRDAQTGYSVYSTIKSSIIDTLELTTVTAAAEVLPWLRKLADNHWKDPSCGDGKCQAPFEFPSYSRFGCRADCSQLDVVEAGTVPLQVDLYYDFEHSTGQTVLSLPPTTLMELAAWNVCPEDAPHGNDCLFEKDQTFQALKGTISERIGGVPPGKYQVVIKRDYFNKIRGAVRNSKNLEIYSRSVAKISVALNAAHAGWEYEISQLQTAKKGLQASLQDLVVGHIEQAHSARLASLQKQQGNTSAFPSLAAYDAAEAALNNTLASLKTNVISRRHHTACQSVLQPLNIAALSNVPADIVWDPGSSAGVADLTAVSWAAGPSATAAELDCRIDASSNACECQRLAAYFLGIDAQRYDNVVSNVVTRLDPNRSAAWTRNYTASLAQLEASNPEQVPYLTSLSMGADYNERLQLKLDTLVAYYFDGPATQGPGGRPNLADEDLSFSVVAALDKNTTAERAASRDALFDGINERLDEIEALIKEAVFGLPEVAALQSGTPAVDYNLVTWHGGKNAYQCALRRWHSMLQGSLALVAAYAFNERVCNLEARAPTYAGQCVAGTAFDTNPKNSTEPYTCKGTPSNGTNVLTGDACTAQIDRQLDCDALCVCMADVQATLSPAQCSTDSDQGSSYCRCQACLDLLPVTQEEGYRTVQDLAIQASTPPSGRRLQQRRKLQQASQTQDLEQLKVSVDVLAASQATLSKSVQDLTGSIEKANTDADSRAADPTLKNLISAGQAQLQVGQATTESLLQEIIGKQNQALELAAASQASLDAITRLTTSALETLENIDKKFETTVNAIKLAASSKMITVEEALGLWKIARRVRLTNERRALLINLPCSYVSNVEIGSETSPATTVLRSKHAFEVQGQLPSELSARGAVRERWVGTSNRVVGGMLIHTTRRQEQECAKTRFPDIQNLCMGNTVTDSFGVDPSFKSGTPSFDPDLSIADMLQIYNCTAAFGDSAVYGVPHPTIPGRVTNLAPYCEQYFNERNFPWGFHSHRIAGHPTGYPIWLDINLSHAEMLRWIQYLEDGLYFDTATERVTFELVTYNADLQLFSKSTLLLVSENGGAYRVQNLVETLKVELYQGAKGALQLFLEIILMVLVTVETIFQINLMVQAQTHEGSFLAYFTGGFDVLDLMSTLMMVVTLTLWWVFVIKALYQFNLSRLLFVYEDPRADAFINKLQDPSGRDLQQAAKEFEHLDELSMLLTWYYSLNGINILVVIVRALHLMHFHPRLGVVTRSLVVALPDLFNFLLVGGVVFVGYVMMGHLLFGLTVERFASLADSMITCLEVIMGDMSINEQLRALPGLMNSIGQLYFWSFELIVFMVLLNFLLAIIVDAFCEVKEATVDTSSILTGVAELIRVCWADTAARFLRHAPDDGLGPRSRISILDMGSWLKHLAFTNAQDVQRHDPTLLVGADSRVLRLGDVCLTKEDLKEVLRQQHDAARAQAPQSEAARKVHPFLKACFGIVEPVDLGDPRQLELMSYWLFERFAEEDASANNADMFDTNDLEHSKKPMLDLVSEEAVNDMYQSLQRKIDRLMQLQAELAEAKVQMQHDGEGGDNG